MEMSSGLIFSGGEMLGTASNAIYTKPMTKIKIPAKRRNHDAPLMLAPINV